MLGTLVMSALLWSAASAQESKVLMPPNLYKYVPNALQSNFLREATPPSDPVIFYVNEANSQVTMECAANGTPEPDIYWHVDGSRVDLNSDTYDLNVLTGQLTVHRERGYRTGIYYCTAENAYATAVSDKIDLRVARIRTGEDSQLMQYTVTEGDSLLLPCRGVSSDPEAVPEWALDKDQTGSPAKYGLSARVNVMDNGSLFFAHVRSEDERDAATIYKCGVFNSVLDTNQYSSPTRISVTERTDGETRASVRHVYSRHSTGSVVGVKGSSVTFKCLFVGGTFGSTEGPKIIWRRSPGDLNDDRFQIDSRSETELNITRVLEGDDGEYTCEGYNRDNPTQTDQFTVTLTVQSKPEFVEQPMNVNVTVGDTVEIKCKVTGDPAPQVTMMVNGEPIQGVVNDHPRYDLVDGNTTFRIRDACKDCATGTSDLNVVQCRAQNIHGYVYEQVYVNVLERTFITRRPESMELDLSAKQAMLHCGGSSDPSTPVQYEWKLNDEKINPQPGRHTVFNNGTILINLNTTEKKMSLAGNYTCVVSNGPYSSDRAQARVYFDRPPVYKPVVAGFFDTHWWIFIIIFFVIFVFLVIVCCCYWHRGDEYNVDEKERAFGMYPEEELFETGFHEYQRPEPPSRKTSLSSNVMLNESTLDKRSMARAYSSDSLGRFTEDGSFIDEYGTARR